MQVTVAGGLGEADRGGPPFNLVPKTGGNNFSGTYFGNIAGKWSQGDNVDDELQSRSGSRTRARSSAAGTRASRSAARSRRTRCGSTARARTFGAYTDIAGRFANANAGNPPRWDYVADQSITQRSATSRKIGGGRVHRSAHAAEQGQRLLRLPEGVRGRLVRQGREQCRVRGDDWIAVGGFGTWSPESTHSRDNAEKIMQFDYTAPVTNKLLLEAAFSQFFSNWGGQTPAGALDQAPFIPVRRAEHRHDQPGVPTGCRWPTCRTTASPVSATTTRRTTSGARRRPTSPARTA